uniref:Tetratricopeptide repeat protein n=1 Tax=Streptomyces sp. NBC_00093 TaxID=2975649 RepID=A0AAU2A256_9ACTN
MTEVAPDPQEAYDAALAVWQRFAQDETEDTAPLTSPGMTQRLECLSQWLLEPSPTVPGPPRGQVAYLLAWAHWARWLGASRAEETAGPKSGHAEEIDRALAASWWLRDLDLAPEPLRPLAGLFQELVAEDWADPERVQDYAGLMLDFARRTGSRNALYEAARRCRQALGLVEEADERWPVIASNLAAAVLALAQETGDHDDLDEAILLAGRALGRLDVPPDELAHFTVQLARLLLIRHDASGEQADLDEAIEMFSPLVPREPAPAQVDDTALHVLASLLRLRYELTSDPVDLPRAIELQEQLVARRGEQDDHYVLAQLLSRHFSHTASVEALDRSIHHYEQAWTIGETHGTPWPPALNGRAWMLNRRFEHTGDSHDRDAAILTARQAVSLMPDDDPALPSALGIFSAALHSRARATGSMPDLSEGMAVVDRALSLQGVAPTDRAIHLLNKAALVTLRYRSGWRAADNELAIALWREAVDLLPPGHPKKSAYSINLIAGLMDRVRHTNDDEALDEALNVGTVALEELPAEHPHRAGLCSNHAITLSLSALRSPDDEKLRNAVTLLDEALSLLPADHPTVALLLVNRGTARAALSGADVSAEAGQDWGAAARLESAPPSVRITAAVQWARNAVARGEDRTAVTAYTLAVGHLTNLADPGLERGDKELHLLEWRNLTAEATEAALAADDPDSALALLDSGRCVQWNARLQSADELARLAEVRPDLAASVQRLTALFAAQDTTDGLLPTVDLPEPDDTSLHTP